MAYKSKYYDPVKAHEYYLKHRTLKGRKKGSTADLNDTGKVAAEEVKERLQAELKAALKKVKKGNTEARKKLRELYKQKYLDELEEIRKDNTMVKPPKEKKQKKAKAASSKGSKGSSKGSSGSKSQKSEKQETKEKPKTEEEKILDIVKQLKEKLSVMSDEQKAQAKELIKSLIEKYKKMVLGDGEEDTEKAET